MLSDFAARLDSHGRVTEGVSAPGTGPAGAGAVKGAFLLDLLPLPEGTGDGLQVQEKLRRVLNREAAMFEHAYTVADGNRHRRFSLRGYALRGGTGAMVVQAEMPGSVAAASTHDAYLQTLMDSIGDVVLAKDADGRYTHANRAAAALLGLGDAVSVVGKSDEDFFDEDQVRLLLEDDHLVLWEGQSMVQRERLLRPPAFSEARWMSVTKEPIRDETGRVLGLVSILRELPEPQRAESVLRRLAEGIRSFGPEPDANIQRVLALCRNQLGAVCGFYVRLECDDVVFCGPPEADGATARRCVSDALLRACAEARDDRPTIMANFHPPPEAAGLPAVELAMDTLVAVPVRLGNRPAGVLFVALANGRTPTVADEELLTLCARLIAVEDARRTSMGDLVDATQRLEETQRLACIGSWEWFPGTGTMHWSRELYDLLGVPRDQQPSLEVWEALVHPHDLLRVKQILAGIQDLATPVTLNYRLRGADGSFRSLQALVEADRDRTGAVHRLWGTTMDVTDRDRADAMARARVRLQAAATLASGVAHDFNNLMAGVLGNAELLQMELDPGGEAGQMLRAIVEAARRAGALAQKMLAFTREGRMHPESADMNAIVSDALELCRGMIPDRVKLELVCGESLWPVCVDPAQICHVVVDLIANALESTEGFWRITVQTVNATLDERDVLDLPDLAPGRYVAVTVTDTGSGMDAETLARVFDPFFSTKFLGRGMSLPAAFGVVRHFGGSITAQSRPGEGAAFRMLLPAVESPASGLSVSGLIPAGARTVLIVDDEAMVLAVTQKLLERLGYRVLAAADGREAVTIAGEHDGKIDVILLDMCMPVMDGAAAFPLLRKMCPDAAILLCSAYDPNDRIKDLLAQGAAGFLRKPYRLEVLAPTVHQAIKG